MEAVIFDFDGLLIDTETTLLQSWTFEWAAWGLEISKEGFFADHGGDVTEERFAKLADAVGPSFRRDVSEKRRLAFRAGLHEDLELNPGVGAWLQEANQLGLRLAVASSSPRAWIVEHLERVGVLDRFEVLACGDEVDVPKPNPAVYKLCLGRLGLAAHAAIAVEDTPHGVSAAQAAGLRCIAIPNPYINPDKVAHADLTLPSASEQPLASAFRR
ncbi:HAD family hydrolase [Nocardioides immobilis]|uniref:HAD family hydrolase n=1 Tax=Nocardioides immobilis TaxID=2049295 RepID=UPI001FE82F11|nr:HAD-IA family hydrolase [Nocardioides immobilis]